MTDIVSIKLDALTSAVMCLVQNSGKRLTRAELCERLGIHRNTLAKRLLEPGFPTPDKSGRWLLSEVLEWELTQLR